MEKHFFTCKDCGGHDLLVKEYYKVARSITELQNCSCGKSENGLAYERNYILYTPGVDFYHLNRDHRLEVANEFEEELDGSEVDEVEVNVYCKNCYNPFGECHQDSDLLNLEVGDVEFFVVCGHCGREIEFGWTFPRRDALIWPVECTDFGWDCIPEPRYRDEWASKSWLKQPIKSLRSLANAANLSILP